LFAGLPFSGPPLRHIAGAHYPLPGRAATARQLCRRDEIMQDAGRVAAVTLGFRVWRDFALLAAEGLAIGFAASALLALAVFAVVR
jgi:hypothetical protein